MLSQLETTKRKQVRPLPDVGLGSCHLAALIHFHSAKMAGTFPFTLIARVCCALGRMRLEGEEGKGGPD